MLWIGGLGNTGRSGIYKPSVGPNLTLVRPSINRCFLCWSFRNSLFCLVPSVAPSVDRTILRRIIRKLAFWSVIRNPTSVNWRSCLVDRAGLKHNFSSSFLGIFASPILSTTIRIPCILLPMHMHPFQPINTHELQQFMKNRAQFFTIFIIYQSECIFLISTAIGA